MRDLYYWNRENFEGLAVLAATLQADELLKPLGRYCELREKGLRRQAFRELEVFIKSTLTWDPATRREVALQILEVHQRVPEAHQFLSQPLSSHFIEPVLADWCEAEPGNALPHCELALWRGDRSLLEKALSQNPSDDRVRFAIVSNLIKSVDFATHHLVEGLFIGDEGEAAAALQRADTLLDGASDPAKTKQLRHDVESRRSLLVDWTEYRSSPLGSFPEWCLGRNRDHGWWKIIYYKDPESRD